jgi:hypothetical protein
VQPTGRWKHGAYSRETRVAARESPTLARAVGAGFQIKVLSLRRTGAAPHSTWPTLGAKPVSNSIVERSVTRASDLRHETCQTE